MSINGPRILYFLTLILLPQPQLLNRGQQFAIARYQFNNAYDYLDSNDRDIAYYQEGNEAVELEDDDLQDTSNLIPDRQPIVATQESEPDIKQPMVPQAAVRRASSVDDNQSENHITNELQGNDWKDTDSSSSVAKDTQDAIDHVTCLIKSMREHAISIIKNMNELETDLLSSNEDESKPNECGVMGGDGSGGNSGSGGGSGGGGGGGGGSGGGGGGGSDCGTGSGSDGSGGGGGSGNSGSYGTGGGSNGGSSGGSDYNPDNSNSNNNKSKCFNDAESSNNNNNNSNDNKGSCNKDNDNNNNNNKYNNNRNNNNNNNSNGKNCNTNDGGNGNSDSRTANNNVNNKMKSNCNINMDSGQSPVVLNEWSLPIKNDGTISKSQTTQDLMGQAQDAVRSWKAQIESCKRVLDDAVAQAAETDKQTASNDNHNRQNSDSAKLRTDPYGFLNLRKPAGSKAAVAAVSDVDKTKSNILNSGKVTPGNHQVVISPASSAALHPKSTETGIKGGKASVVAAATTAVAAKATGAVKDTPVAASPHSSADEMMKSTAAAKNNMIRRDFKPVRLLKGKNEERKRKYSGKYDSQRSRNSRLWGN